MTVLETGNYIKQLFRIKICKDGAAAPAGKRYGIKAYPAAENDDVKQGRNRRSTMVSANRAEDLSSHETGLFTNRSHKLFSIYAIYLLNVYSHLVKPQHLWYNI